MTMNVKETLEYISKLEKDCAAYKDTAVRLAADLEGANARIQELMADRANALSDTDYYRRYALKIHTQLDTVSMIIADAKRDASEYAAKKGAEPENPKPNGNDKAGNEVSAD